MMHDRRPEVKSVDAVNTFDAAPLEKKTTLAGEVLKKTRMCSGTRTAARKKVSGVMRGSADSLKLRKSQSGNNENAIK